ncbi:hypothetical protein L226DRAFT_307181 [Lentinus tigrinus ALCF2SS1-7]|uniref:F-box domain-containing protein n=1 Tax=Lentinus tigrinus ALCF2SS1-6 TaxID=1328759 RepID=A0A5C2RXD7_9APHY|nr:hypothetical protein L227DRAFT_299145 [Lentinus tigrinus ALCF2SS1-6]RPD69124.1 hypothetical protein L226DRAFT_307181 [Lentinus tigrinus ALCF2SS1-7]
MPPYIPPEITDDIISAVAFNRYYGIGPSRTHTLAMCALVCRAWLPRSRVELFEDIPILDERTYDLLVERVLRSETMSRYLTSVNSLVLGRSYTSDPPSKAARLFFVEFAGKLPGLGTLCVFDIDFTHQGPFVRWPLLLSQFRTITFLMLWNCQFSSFSDVRRLLTALPLLSTLNIDALTWPVVSQGLVHLQTTPRLRTYWSQLHTLRIYPLSPGCTAVFLRWLTGALHGSPVKVLHYGLPSTGSLQEAVEAFTVGRVGLSVTDLDIRIRDTSPLSGFIALKQLSCSLYEYQGNWEGVASVLQGVSSSMIQYIMFNNVYTHRLQSQEHNDATYLRFDDDTLEQLDRVLSGDPFSRLREIILYVDADKEDEGELLRAHARRCLPELHKRKILRLYVNRKLQHLDVK